MLIAKKNKKEQHDTINKTKLYFMIYKLTSKLKFQEYVTSFMHFICVNIHVFSHIFFLRAMCSCLFSVFLLNVSYFCVEGGGLFICVCPRGKLNSSRLWNSQRSSKFFIWNFKTSLFSFRILTITFQFRIRTDTLDMVNEGESMNDLLKLCEYADDDLVVVTNRNQGIDILN